MITYSSARPATYRKAVVLCCDAGFLPQAAFLLAQIAAQNPDADFDLCLCSEDGLTLPDTLQHLPVRQCQLMIPDAVKDAPQSYRVNLSSYLRLFLPTAFAAEYDRLLYLDADILLRGGDLSRLLDIPLLADHPAAAARTAHQRTQPRKQMREFKALGLPPAPYFNAGVLMIDVPRWEAAHMLDRALELIATKPEVLVMHDQSVLNILLRDKWSELSVVWNWQYAGRFSHLAEAFAPYLLHFAGRYKPWNTFDGQFPPQYPDAYRAFFADHFPDLAAEMPPAPSILKSAGFHRKALLKQWFDFNRLAAYIGRFDDPYSVIDPRK